MADEFWIKNEQVVAECCSGILPEDSEIEREGRLDLFRRWLFKPANEEIPFDEIKFRLAPSIIIRSEAELFGVSSPRFAIRAYLTENSFVNIRRNLVLRKMIGETIKNATVREDLIKDLEQHDFAWAADSLLEIPKRFVLCPEFAQVHSVLSEHPTSEGGYKFLVSNLGNEFGEKFDGPLVPFATHISVGGGLCAQASCFMSLCLTECKQVLGISEITKLAWAESETATSSTVQSVHPDGVVPIHGLNSERIASFFSKEEIGLEAQLQTIVGKKGVFPFIKLAIQTYVANQIPLNVITSISRMLGWHDWQADPIIRLNGFEMDDNDRSRLPIGLPDKRIEKLGEKQGNDHHCVVIVGASNNKVCINDPATFPFLEVDFGQLIEARAYLPKHGEEEIGAESAAEMCAVDPAEFASNELAPFRMISVTPSSVKAPLLDFVMKKRGDDSESITLPGSTGVMKKAFDTQQEERSLMGQEGEIVPMLGRYYLVHKRSGSTGEVRLDSKRSGLPDFDRSLLTGIVDDWYWVQEVEHPISKGEKRQMLWFWRASAEEGEIDGALVIVLVQENESDENAYWRIRE